MVGNDHVCPNDYWSSTDNEDEQILKNAAKSTSKVTINMILMRMVRPAIGFFPR